ncbi:MAG: Abi family protein [Rickettsiales bacterium]|nr:Abi family protein [Rickettsiales bacterium]
MSQNSNKTFYTAAEHIILLQERGMTIADVDQAKAHLERIGYYRLSAYWHPFKISDDNGGHAFAESTSFETILELYKFDSELRFIALGVLEQLEVVMRSQISMILGSQHPLAHRITSYLDGKLKLDQHGIWLGKLDKKSQTSKEKFAHHFREKYPDKKMPIWIAVELFDFGMLAYLVDFMNYRDKEQLAKAFGLPSGRFLSSWMKAMNIIRNTAAHHSRLWNKAFALQPQLPKKDEIDMLAHLRDDPAVKARLYCYFAFMKILTDNSCPDYQWAGELKQLMARFPTTDIISIKQAGFIDGWSELELWK